MAKTVCHCFHAEIEKRDTEEVERKEEEEMSNLPEAQQGFVGKSHTDSVYPFSQSCSVKQANGYQFDTQTRMEGE